MLFVILSLVHLQVTFPRHENHILSPVSFLFQISSDHLRVWTAQQDVDLVISPFTGESTNLNLPIYKHSLDINYFTYVTKRMTHDTRNKAPWLAVPFPMSLSANSQLHSSHQGWSYF